MAQDVFGPLDECNDEIEECIHGIPTWQHCDECDKDDEGDERYHAAKDDGLLEEGYDFQNKNGKFVGYYENPDG